MNQNQKIKSDLVHLFKVLDYFNLNDLTANHASLISSNNKGFFINQHKHFFSQVKSGSLVYVDLDEKFSRKYSNVNKAGFQIHRFIHNSKFKPKAILHTHSVNSVAISCLKEGFPCSVNC